MAYCPPSALRTVWRTVLRTVLGRHGALEPVSGAGHRALPFPSRAPAGKAQGPAKQASTVTRFMQCSGSRPSRSRSGMSIRRWGYGHGGGAEDGADGHGHVVDGLKAGVAVTGNGACGPKIPQGKAVRCVGRGLGCGGFFLFRHASRYDASPWVGPQPDCVRGEQATWRDWSGCGSYPTGEGTRGLCRLRRFPTWALDSVRVILSKAYSSIRCGLS